MPAPLALDQVHEIELRSLVRGLWLRVDYRGLDPRSVLRGSSHPNVLRASIFRRGRIGDLMGTTFGGPRVMSGRCRDLLMSLKLTGWGSIPIRLEPSVAEPLWLLTVTGLCGRAYSKTLGGPPDMQPLGTYIDPRKWDGSDLFMPENLDAFLLAPNRVTDLRRARLRNVEIVPTNLEPIAATG